MRSPAYFLVVIDVAENKFQNFSTLKVSHGSLLSYNYESFNMEEHDEIVELFVEGTSIWRLLFLNIFTLDEMEKVGTQHISFPQECDASGDSSSYDLQIKSSPIITFENDEKRSNRQISVLLQETSSYIRPVLHSYFSRAFPYHSIVFLKLVVHDSGRLQIAEYEDRDGVYISTLDRTAPIPDVIVWQYGYVGEEGAEDVDIESGSKHYVEELYHQWLFLNPNINILFMSGEAKEFIDFFGNKPHLPKAMINATYSPRNISEALAPGNRPAKSGIMFLNTVRDESYFPVVDHTFYCFNPSISCLPVELMHYLATVSTSAFESFDASSPYIPTNPLTNEKSNSDIRLLLRPRGHLWANEQLQNKQNAVAYLYNRCDRPEREDFFRSLILDNPTLAGRVYALGNCNGDLEEAPNYSSNSDMLPRDNVAYSHGAVDQYKNFKFVVAFENTFVKGYITEKLTNAYFAGAIPIYLGAPDVHDFFQKDSMINCNDFNTLRECAQVCYFSIRSTASVLTFYRAFNFLLQYVAFIDSNDDLYISILQTPPMTSIVKWCELYNWHPLTQNKCTMENNFRIPLAMRRNFRVS